VKKMGRKKKKNRKKRGLREEEEEGQKSGTGRWPDVEDAEGADDGIIVMEWWSWRSVRQQKTG